MVGGSLRARIEIIAGDYVDTNITWPGDVGLTATCRRDGRFAAAIVEQLHVGTAKVSISYAVDDVVKAWLGEAEPGRVVEHFVGDVLRRGGERDGEDDGERQPEQHERQETVKVAPHQWKVGLVGGGRLEARLAHELFGIDYDADVTEKCDEERNEYERYDEACVRSGERATIWTPKRTVMSTHLSRMAAGACCSSGRSNRSWRRRRTASPTQRSQWTRLTELSRSHWSGRTTGGLPGWCTISCSFQSMSPAVSVNENVSMNFKSNFRSTRFCTKLSEVLFLVCG